MIGIVLSSVSGIDYAPSLDVDGRSVRVIGLNALIKNKRAAGRPRELADVAKLENQARAEDE